MFYNTRIGTRFLCHEYDDDDDDDDDATNNTNAYTPNHCCRYIFYNDT